ncbi:hypothetical protein LshimejAT787_1402560 [Lyophyllum shimeji]|uniref:Uncharacterized protein n=1 Tax=Lyophyllum shimeji TaxID=47721 RepID=A0A9P3PY66_LYOSH|nr:hypothetical protein LshimejAT787_1402560 [Lyophyllum shimeji]
MILGPFSQRVFSLEDCLCLTSVRPALSSGHLRAEWTAMLCGPLDCDECREPDTLPDFEGLDALVHELYETTPRGGSVSRRYLRRDVGAVLERLESLKTTMQHGRPGAKEAFESFLGTTIEHVEFRHSWSRGYTHSGFVNAGLNDQILRQLSVRRLTRRVWRKILPIMEAIAPVKERRLLRSARSAHEEATLSWPAMMGDFATRRNIKECYPYLLRSLVYGLKTTPLFQILVFCHAR